MNLLTYGNGVQRPGWGVTAAKPVGFCRVYYIISGEVGYEDEHGTRKLKLNHLYFFPSVKPYKICHNPQNPINCLWWHMDLFPIIVSELLELDVSKKDSFHYLIETANAYYAEYGGATAFYNTLASLLVEYCCDHDWLQKPFGKIPEILEYIDTHCSQPVSIEEISRHFNYTPEHFIRMFQKETNFTPYQYLIHRRMTIACSLLLQGMSVKETALSVGYQDTKVFAYRFKETFMIPPSHYRKFYHPTA